MASEGMYNALVEYIIENQERFYKFSYSYTRNREMSLDIVQNAVCIALEKYYQIRDVKNINAWFFRVLLNETYAYLKKHNRECLSSDEFFQNEEYIEKAYDKDDEVYWLIDCLSPELKSIIILRFFEELSLDEISKVTKMNLNTVKTRLYSALRKMKRIYDEGAEDDV